LQITSRSQIISRIAQTPQVLQHKYELQ